MNQIKKGLETPELIARILLDYPKDFIIIESEQSFIESLWRLSFKPPFAVLFSQTTFQKDRGMVKSPAITETLNEMIGFMIVPDENIPGKYNLNRKELSDYVSKFEGSNFDKRHLKKIGEKLFGKLAIKWEYSELKKNNAMLKSAQPNVEPQDNKIVADEI